MSGEGVFIFPSKRKAHSFVVEFVSGIIVLAWPWDEFYLRFIDEALLAVMAETISLFLLYAIVENSISLIFAGWRNVLFALHGDFIAKAEGAGPVPEG